MPSRSSSTVLLGVARVAAIAAAVSRRCRPGAWSTTPPHRSGCSAAMTPAKTPQATLAHRRRVHGSWTPRVTIHSAAGLCGSQLRQHSYETLSPASTSVPRSRNPSRRHPRDRLPRRRARTVHRQPRSTGSLHLRAAYEAHRCPGLRLADHRKRSRGVPGAGRLRSSRRS